MKKKIKKIRALAIQKKEDLSYGNIDNHEFITKLDNIIGGTFALEKAVFILVCFFSAFTVVGVGTAYPDARLMSILLEVVIICSGIAWAVLFIQIKRWQFSLDMVPGVDGEAFREMKAEPSIEENVLTYKTIKLQRW